MPGTLVTLRHGQSTWNLENLFTGWHDVPLTAPGRGRGRRRGRAMADAGLCFDTSHTSVLVRAVDHAATSPSPRWASSGSRCSATGGSTSATTAPCRASTRSRRPSGTAPSRPSCGAAATTCRRRPSTPASPEHPANDRRYRSLAPEVLPASECLADVVARVLPYWQDVIAPQLLAGLDVLVTAHGNSLRALLMHLEGVSRDEIPEVNVPTGVPRRYEFDDASTVAVRRVPRRPRRDRRQGRRRRRPGRRSLRSRRRSRRWRRRGVA